MNLGAQNLNLSWKRLVWVIALLFLGVSGINLREGKAQIIPDPRDFPVGEVLPPTETAPPTFPPFPLGPGGDPTYPPGVVPDGGFGQGLQVAVLGLTGAIQELNTAMLSGEQSLEDYKPQVQALTQIGSELANAVTKLQVLASDNVPGAVTELGNTADALTRLADFAGTLQEHPTELACGVVLVIASGIVVGKLLADHVFVLDKDKNIVYRGFKNAGSLLNRCFVRVRGSKADSGSGGANKETSVTNPNHEIEEDSNV